MSRQNPLSRFLRFRLWQLLLIMAVVSGGLWLVTQAGMETCEIEIIDMMGLNFEGPNGSFDNFGSRSGVIRLRYLRPVDETKTRVNLFLNSTDLNSKRARDVASVKLVEGSRIVFRYRKKPVLWMKADNLREISILKLGLEPADIEEVISDYYFESPDDFETSDQ